MRRSIFLTAALLLLAGVVSAGEAEFSFYSRHGRNYFELRLPREWHSTDDATVLAKTAERSPRISFLYPRRIKPYEKDSYFAGMYRGHGRFEVEVAVVRYGDRIERKVLTPTGDFPAEPPSMPDEAWRRYAAAQSRDADLLLERTPQSSFQQYVRLLNAERADVPLRKASGRQPRWVRVARRPVDLFSATTGALAIQESLQLQQMRGIAAEREEKEYAVEELRSVNLATHPYDELLRGRKPVSSPLARAVPRNFYYARFRSPDKLLNVLTFLERWGNHFLRTYRVRAQDNHWVEKHLEQMLLGTNPILKELLRRVVGEMAVVGSDPFFSSGTDLTLLIRTETPAPLESYLSRKAEEARGSHPDLRVETRSHQGVDMTVVQSPDGSVSTVFGYAEGIAFVGNSPAAIKQIVDALMDSSPGLDEAPDFRYMRSVFPVSAEEEDGFIYLSETWFRRMVGPKLRTLEYRRRQCVNELRIIENGATLYQLERGGEPGSLEQLKQAGYLPHTELYCPDGGSYSYDAAANAGMCSVHGRIPLLRPHVGQNVDKVTMSEMQGYNRFARDYNNYWRRYIDPVGIRIEAGEQMKFETRVMPLAENSIYNRFRPLVGGEGVNLHGPLFLQDAIVASGGKLNFEALLEGTSLLEAANTEVGGNCLQALKSVCGPSAFIVICDGVPLYRFDFSQYVGEMVRWDMSNALMALPVLSGLQLPAYGAIKIKDREGFEEALHGLHQFLARRAGEKQFGRFALHVDFSRLPSIRGHRGYEVGLRLFSFELRYYYSRIGDYLYAANRLSLLRRLARKYEEQGGTRDEVVGNMMLRFIPDNWDHIRETLALGWENRSRQACFENLSRIEPLLKSLESESAEPVSRGQWRRTFFCPDGGTYSLRHGRARCSVHEHPGSPTQPTAPHASNRLLSLLEQCSDIALEFSFTEHGIASEVTVTMGKTRTQ